MPGLDFGLVECAKGAFASAEKDWVLSLADASDRIEPLTPEVDMLTAVASDSSNEEGLVKVRTVMAVNVGQAWRGEM